MIDAKMSYEQANIKPDTLKLIAPHRNYMMNFLVPYDISFIFNTNEYDKGRDGVRANFNDLFGPGADLITLTGAAYLISPGKNKIILLPHVDPTLVDYFVEQQFLLTSDIVYVNNLQELHEYLTHQHRKVYGFDDLGRTFDSLTMNSQTVFEFGNSKDSLRELTTHIPHEETLFFNTTDHHAVFKKIWECSDNAIYIKCCNTESGGYGVKRIPKNQSLEQGYQQFNELVKQRDAMRIKYKLKDYFILQQGLFGTCKSFQVFLDPAKPHEIQLVAISTQVMWPDGVSFAYNQLESIIPEHVNPIQPIILEMVANFWKKYPEAKGFLGADYILQM